MDPPSVDLRPRSSSFGPYTSDTLATYPAPLVIEPATSHRMTFILLHGRGSKAYTFGSQLLNPKDFPVWKNTDEQTLRIKFPDVKFVFPTAAKHRSSGSSRSMSKQWFDCYSPLSVEGQCKNEEWQIEGLRETCELIHSLLRHEVSIIGAGNVVLGGLSQGCAASLVALLLWDGPPLKAMFGMCGWLPLRKRIEDMTRDPHPDCEVAPCIEFRTDGDINADASLDRCTQALQYLHDQLDLPSNTYAPPQVFQQVPIFLGHGTLDEKVPIGLFREAAHCLKILGANVESKEYQDLGHWYSPQMLGDVVEFLINSS